MPNWRAWVAILPAISLDVVLPASGYYLTSRLCVLLARTYPIATGCEKALDSELSTDSSLRMTLFVLPLSISYLFSAVTRAVYIRVAAALLPAEDEYIVPFDGTFGTRNNGRRTSPLVILDACRTITKEGFFRYLRTIQDVAFFEWLILSLMMTALFIQVGLMEPCIALEYLQSIGDEPLGVC